MRYVTVELTWNGRTLHPLEGTIATTTGVELVASHYIYPAGNGTYVELLEFRGETNTLRNVFEQTSGVLDYEVTAEDGGFAFVHFESTPLFEVFFEAALENTVVLQYPVQFITGDSEGGVRVTLLGTDEAFTAAFDELPDIVNVSLLRTGRYTDPPRDPIHALSEKQRTLLQEAKEAGYYETPRETTQAELADTLGVSRATISDRLQRLEATIIKSVT